MPSPRLRLAAALFFAFTASACGQDEDPEGARVLWDKINAGPGFHSWQRAPGYAVRMPSFTSHSNAVEIFVSGDITTALDPKSTPVATSWPVGSIIVKEGFGSLEADSRKLVAVMEKRVDGWFWAEYDGRGTSHYSGRPSVCTDCHAHRQGYSDWVYAFELPR